MTWTTKWMMAGYARQNFVVAVLAPDPVPGSTQNCDPHTRIKFCRSLRKK